MTGTDLETMERVAPAVHLAAEAKAAREHVMTESPSKPVAKSADKAAADKSNVKLATGIAMGIGSAALVAALLYVNRDKKDGPKKG
ncbi:hypothetical protein [Allosphingosinicella indica]|uniref:Uncharacterized protein n=1 Tax=Allosphingosinicella indica TaxID=941907 RepID=A0A1X7GYM1_9SPHN|nr:hypothetical protein [Allosphingosinicella indica]SMF76298.1 hypothetical protein SAMN06295910_2439 [Allosphingosinicella indica]